MRRMIIRVGLLVVMGLALAGCSGTEGTPAVALQATVTATVKTTSTTTETVDHTVTETVTPTPTPTPEPTPEPTPTPQAGPTSNSYATPLTIVGNSDTLPTGYDAHGLFFGTATPQDTYSTEEDTICGANACFHMEVWDDFGCSKGIKAAIDVYDGPAEDDNAPKIRTDVITTTPTAAQQIGRTLVVIDRTGSTQPTLSFAITDVSCVL